MYESDVCILWRSHARAAAIWICHHRLKSLPPVNRVTTMVISFQSQLSSCPPHLLATSSFCVCACWLSDVCVQARIVFACQGVGSATWPVTASRKLIGWYFSFVGQGVHTSLGSLGMSPWTSRVGGHSSTGSWRLRHSVSFSSSIGISYLPHSLVFHFFT